MDDDYVKCLTACFNQVDSFAGVDACYSSELAHGVPFLCHGSCGKTSCSTYRDTEVINSTSYLEVANCVFDPVSNVSTVYYQDKLYECSEMDYHDHFSVIFILVAFLFVVFALPGIYNYFIIPKVFPDFYEDLKANVSFQSYSVFQVGNLITICTTLFLMLFSIIYTIGYLDFNKFILFLSYFIVACLTVAIVVPMKLDYKTDALKMVVLLNLAITVPHLIFAYCLGGGAQAYYSIFYYCWIFLLPLVRYTGRFAEEEDKHNAWIRGGPAYFKFEQGNYGG